MGFREFISNFRYRRRLDAEFERYQNMKPPAKPSRRHIDKLVSRLLNENTAWNARRELKMIGRAVVPSLLAALNDPRFRRAKWEEYSPAPVPLDSTLELLVSHAGDEVVRIGSQLAKSLSAAVRQTSALHLASAGSANAIAVLQELMQDDDGHVRSYVRIGIHRALTEERADEEFRRQAYDLLLSQCEQDWGSAMNDAADTIVVLDPVRAAVDLADERWLNLSNHNAYRIIEACNRENVLLPESIIHQLLNAALLQAVGERCYPNDYLAAAALGALALRNADGTGAIAESLLNHENDQVKEAAAEALAELAGIPNPTGFVIARVSEEGYEALSHVQRVVYCAFLFDAEVCNGGLMQFFGNTSGDLAIDTLTALSELAHNEGYLALDSAMKLLGPLAREPDRELRLTAFEGRWDDLHSAFDPLESAYYATQARLRQASVLYALRHPEDFRR